MPYISDLERREALRNGVIADIAGELNCQIFMHLRSCLDEVGIESFEKDYDSILILKYVSDFLADFPNYQKYNDMVGALTCCYKEFYRRFGIKVKFLLDIIDMYDVKIGNYEDTKIEENRDVV